MMPDANAPYSDTSVSAYSDKHPEVSIADTQSQDDTPLMNSAQDILPAIRKTLEPEIASVSSDEIAPQPLPISDASSASADLERRGNWNSFWLKGVTLIGIAVANASLLVTTVILNRVSASQHGFPVAYSSNRYLWAYLPTALFAALAALWHQVDHQCRVLTPWSELLKGPAPADKTLLLDYISPLSPVVLWRAIRNRHWAVAASTTASVLLDVCILFSTSLLSISLATLTEPVQDIPFKTMLSKTNTSDLLNQPDPAFVYYGTNSFQISSPLGSDLSRAYELPDFDQLRPGTYTANVSTFQSDLVCSTATTNHSIGQSVISNKTYPRVQLDISTPECETYQSFGLANLGLNWTADSMRSVLGGDNRNVTCRQDDVWSNHSIISFFVADVQSQYVPDFTSGYGPGSEFDHVKLSINASTVLLCWPAAALVKQPFQFDGSGRSASGTTYNVTNPDYLDDSLVLQGVYGTLDTLGGNTRPGPQQLFEDTDQTGLQALLSPFVAFIYMDFQNWNVTITRLTDAKWLDFCAQNAFYGLVAQVARTSFSVAHAHTYNGTHSYEENRLFIQLESTAVIGACLLLTSILTLLIIRCRPWNVVPRDPSSVLGLATILASSPALNQQLQQKSTLSDKELAQSLQHTSFRTLEVPTFKIHSEDTVNRVPADITTKWWRPIWAHPVVGASIIIYVLLIVAALEAIQRVSRTHPFVVAMYAYYTSLLGSSLPALFLIGAKLLLTSLAGCVAMFSPFATTLGDQYLPRNALLRSSIYKMPIINAVQSLKAVQLNVALASFAAVCGGFLTIFASGLISSDYDVRITNETVTQLDTFNISSVFRINNPKLPEELFSLIDQLNATEPEDTWRTLVYPHLNIDKVESKDYWYGNITVHMPAVRGSLNCTFVPQQELELSFSQSSESYVSIIHSNNDVPANCMLANDTYRKDNYSVIMGSMDQAYAASFRQWLPNSDRNASVVADELVGCPNLLYILGYFDMEAETASNVSAMYCYQTVEQVEPDAIPYSSRVYFGAPVVNESSIVVLQARAHYPGMKWFSSVTSFNQSHDLKVFDSVPVRADLFTQHLLFGIDGVPLEELIGMENRPRLLQAVQNLYGRYMVQPIDSMRIKATGPPITHPAIFDMSGWTYRRFTQSETSKLMLQILLSIMAVCGTLAYVLTPMRKVLMHSPSSIAGTMTLLAGSRLCSRAVLPEGSEFLDDKGLDVLLSKYVFTMGWHEEDDDKAGGDKTSKSLKEGEDDRPRGRRRYGIEAVER